MRRQWTEIHIIGVRLHVRTARHVGESMDSSVVPSYSPIVTERQLANLVEHFEAGRLPREQWKHAAHLRVACWYIAHHSPDQALQLMRTGIQRFNAVHGIEAKRDGGYHETLTRFWFAIARASFEATAVDLSLAARVASVIERLSDKKLVLEYYSRERIMSQDARLGWLEPDIQPLPGA